MASESLFSLLLVEYDEPDRRHILSFIAKILGAIKKPKCRSISRNRLQKKTKHSDVIFNILYIAGFRDNEAKTRMTLSETDIPTAQNVFRQIPSELRSPTTINTPNVAESHQNAAFEESKSQSPHSSHVVTSDIQTLINMGFTQDQSIHALQASVGNVALAAQIILENHDIDGMHESANTTQKCYVEQCSSVTNIANQLNMYNGSLNAHVSAELVSLLNDFDHLLIHHDNDDDFEYIYNTLTHCQIKHCLISKRHHRDRSIETTQMSRIPLSHDTMDKIHSYLLHSYDIGYRLKSQDEEAIAHDDPQLWQLYVSTQSLNKYTALTGADKEVIGKHYSFGQQFYYWDYFKNDAGVLAAEDRYRQSGYKRKEWYVPPKYNSLKEELLNNELAVITPEQWDAQCTKASKHHQTKYCKKITAQSRGGGEANPVVIDTTIFGITEGTQITVQHLLAVSCYCAFSQLCTRFSETYRRSYDVDEKEYVNDIVNSVRGVRNIFEIHDIFNRRNVNKAMHSEFGSDNKTRENDYDFKKRHSNFHHFAKHLFESVNVFVRHPKPNASANNWTNKRYYHGATSEFLFDSMKCSMHQPFSTTMSLPVAANFASHGDEEGVVLEINSEPFTRYFECRHLSNFPKELEVLFFENFHPVMIQNIILMKSGKESKDHDFPAYIEAIHVLESMISDIQLGFPKQVFEAIHHRFFHKKNQLKMINLIEMELSRYDKRQKRYPIHEYIVTLFHNICIKRQIADINWEYLQMMLLCIVKGMDDFDCNTEDDYYFLRALFCTDQDQMLNLNVLGTLFPNLTTILFHHIDTITLQSLRYLFNYLALDRAKKLCRLVVYVNGKETSTSSVDALVTHKEILPLIEKMSLLKWKIQIKQDDLGRDTIVLKRVIILVPDVTSLENNRLTEAQQLKILEAITTHNQT